MIYWESCNHIIQHHGYIFACGYVYLCSPMIHDGGTSLVSSWQIRQLGHERQHFSYLNDVRASAFPPLPTAVNVQNADIQGYETTSEIDVHPPKGRKRGRPASTPTKSNRAQKATYESSPTPSVKIHGTKNRKGKHTG